jgi:heat shock protein HslJ
MEPVDDPRRRNAMRSKAILVVSLALVIAACGEGDPIADPIDPSGGWQLVSGTVEGTPVTPIATHPVTIEFNDGSVGGTSACNSYGGDYSVDGATITISEVFMTEMACSPEEVMSLESQYLSALGAVSSFAMDGSNLVLSGDEVEFEFEPVITPPTAEMMGTVWVLESVVDGDSVSSVAGERATLEFFSDGSFLGSTGCRNLAGNYVETSTGITTTDMTTAGECPDELSIQDNSVVTVLNDEYRVDIEGATMTLTIATEEGLVYRAGA